MNAQRMKLDLGARWGHLYFTWRALGAVWAAIVAVVVWVWHQQQQLWTCQADNHAQAQQIKDLQRRIDERAGAANNRNNKGE